MGFYFFTFFALFISVLFYTRYIPVRNIPCADSSFMDQNTIILDIRDYNDSKMEFSHDSINIPYGYLKRYYHEIARNNIHVVASNRTELNLGLRFLIKRGFRIVSFQIIDCPCKKVG